MTKPQTGADQQQPNALPQWNLADLYPALDAPELKADLEMAHAQARHFYETYHGRIAELSGDELGQAMQTYERIDELLSRIMSYAVLLHASDMSHPEHGRFYQSMYEKTTAISGNLLFFTLEINRIDDADLAEKMGSKELADYAPVLRDLRIFRDHQLDDDKERLLHEHSMVSRTAWVRLFDETVSRLRFLIDGEVLTTTKTMALLSHPDANKREQAARAISRELENNIHVFSLVTNTLAKERELDDKWRRYPRPDSLRNKTNHVEDDVIDAMVSTVRSSYPRLSHRYYAIKAQWMGQKKLQCWDRTAPLPEEDHRHIPWNEARDTVLGAYHDFSPQMGDIAQRFFDNDWIDAAPRPGKEVRAFSHPCVPSVHPYILLNYMGRSSDVMTLAHEIGHGVHHIMSSQQGHLKAEPHLPMAQIASVFGEMLTFQSLLDHENDPHKRRLLLASKIEDMLNTITRQVAFYDFEWQVHTERRQNGELTADRIGDIWMQISKDSLGPAFEYDNIYRHFWAYIPHFIHSPFYAYAYAFSECLVNALYAVYTQADNGFVEKYLAMLEAGGSKSHHELLAPFDLDARDPAFWNKGLGLVESFIDQLEALPS